MMHNMSSTAIHHLHQKIEALQLENAELKENLQYMTDQGITAEDEAEKRTAELEKCYGVLRGIKKWMRLVPKTIVMTKTPQTAGELEAEDEVREAHLREEMQNVHLRFGSSKIAR
jgi:hypothetical protein